jgi:adenosine deaminase
MPLPRRFSTANNFLAEDYLAVHTELRFSKKEVHRFIEQAVSSSWLPAPRKRTLLERVRAEIQAIDEGASP